MTKKIISLFLILFCSISLHAEHKIFHQDGGYVGDFLSSLYNAYVYAKKYNLKVELTTFNGYELFECCNLLDTVSSYGPSDKLIQIRSESDVIHNLHRPDVNFYVNVLSDRPAPDAQTAAEARKLFQPNRNLNLDHITALVPKDVTTVAVHVRKGNGGGNYDGELASEQLFEFDRNMVHYLHDSNKNPFSYYRTAFKLISYKSNNRDSIYRLSLDQHWMFKFPPEQYYIDQIRKVIAAKGGNIVVKIITDDKNPVALVERFRAIINSPQTRIEYHDNRHRDYKTRIIEDLYLMSLCDILIRSKSGFGVVAEVMGDIKTVIFPVGYTWQGNRLIMNQIVIRGEPL